MIPLLEVLACIGLALSLYFTMIRFRVIDANTRIIPRFCRLATGDCVTVVRHPDASVFFISNSILGFVYYVAVLVALDNDFASWLPVVILSWFAVATSVYLMYSLVMRVRVLCVLCIVAHVINVAIALGVTFL